MPDIRHINSVSKSLSKSDSNLSAPSNNSVDTASIKAQFGELQASLGAMRSSQGANNNNLSNATNNVNESNRTMNVSDRKSTEAQSEQYNFSNNQYDAEKNSATLTNDATVLEALAQRRPKLKELLMGQAQQKRQLAALEKQRGDQMLASEHDAQMRMDNEQARHDEAKINKNKNVQAQNEAKNAVNQTKPRIVDANTQLNTVSSQISGKSQRSTQVSQPGRAASSTQPQSTANAIGGTVALGNTSRTGSNATLGAQTTANSPLGTNGSINSALGAAFGGAGGGYLSAAYGAIAQIAQINKQPISPHPTAQVAKWTSIQSIAERGVAYIEAAILDQTISGTPLHQVAILLKTILNTVLGEARGNVEAHTKTIEEYKKAEKDTHQLAQRA